jgi:hypothetical protein
MSRYGLELPGWWDSSWGYDEALGSYFAQLYKDDEPVDDEDTPQVWLSGIDHTYHSPDATVPPGFLTNQANQTGSARHPTHTSPRSPSFSCRHRSPSRLG